jgi:hypothetical protein
MARRGQVTPQPGTPGTAYAGVPTTAPTSDPYHNADGTWIDAGVTTDANGVTSKNYNPGQPADVVQTYGTGGAIAAKAESAIGDAYNFAAGDPRGQKEAYDAAGKAYQDLGSNVQGQYNGLDTKIQGYFGAADADLAAQRANPATQQEQAFRLAQGAARQPTKEEGYADYLAGTIQDPTKQESLAANDTYGGNLTDVEQLYQERKGGNDPAAAYEDSRAQRAIDNRAAAGGGYNSGAGIRNVSDYYANVGAQRSNQLASLAGASSSAAGQRAGYRENLASGADTSRLNVNNAYGQAGQGADSSRLAVNNAVTNASQGASKEQSDYFSGVSKQSSDLAFSKAGISKDLGDKAIEAYKNGQVASIQAYLAKAGVDAKALQALNESLNTAVKLGA